MQHLNLLKSQSTKQYFLLLLIFLFTYNLNTQANSLISNDSVYAIAERMPQFPGGDAAKTKFLLENVRYPERAQENNEQGRVNVQFIVNKNGKIENAKVVKSVSSSLDEEALRVINSFPDWISGEINGKKVSVYQIVSIHFRNTTNEESNWGVTDKTVIVIDSLIMPCNFNLKVLNPIKIANIKILKPFPAANMKNLIQTFGKRAENGVILISSKKPTYIIRNDSLKNISLPTDNQEKEKAPEFPGGDEKLFQFMADNIKYPVVARENGIQGKVITQFFINAKGEIEDAKIIKSVESSLDNESLRLISILPKFIPATINGIPATVKYTLPINFKIQDESNSIINMSNDWNDDKKQIILLDDEILPSGFDLHILDMSKITNFNTYKPNGNKIIREYAKRYEEVANYGLIVIKTNRNQDNLSDENLHEPVIMDGIPVYYNVDKKPQFPTRQSGLNEFISKSVFYPEVSKQKKEQGVVKVQFTVSKTGKISNQEILSGVSEDLDKEALRIVNTFPDWIPAEEDDVLVNAITNVEISFELDKWKPDNKTVIVVDNQQMPCNFNQKVINVDRIDSITELRPSNESVKNELIMKYGENADHGVILITTQKEIVSSQAPNSLKNEPFDRNEPSVNDSIMPKFPEGEKAMFKFIAENLKYPELAKKYGIEGKVFVRVIIDKNGEIKDARLLESIDPYLDKEALRVVNTLPNWIPAERCGKKINVYATIPVNFRLKLKDEERKMIKTNEKMVLILDNEKMPTGFNLKKLSLEEIASYTIVQPTTKEIVKKLVSKFGEEAKDGAIIITTLNPKLIELQENKIVQSGLNKNTIPQIVEIMPEFPGGDNKLFKYLSENIKYPDSAQERKIQGRVICQFIVDTDGSIVDVEVIRGIEKSLDKEAVRVLRSMPNWIPGKQRGKPVQVKYTFPVSFRLE